MQPQSGEQNAYTEQFGSLYLAPEDFEAFDIALPDDKLRQMLVKSLEEDRSYWNQAPWKLEETDKESVAYFFGDQLNASEFVKGDIKYQDNRLFTSVRAILSYVTAQLAKPSLTPSKGDQIYLKAARDLQLALYQHSIDEKADRKVRSAVLNLIIRKRGYLKLRWCPNAGVNGDVVTDICDPEDIIISRNARYLDNPDRIHHRIRCSVDELIAHFPKKEEEIKTTFGIIQGRYSQMSRFITYFETWFTYIEKGKPKEGICWFIPEQGVILDKAPNPNWIYTGDETKDKKENLLPFPPKPFVAFNYINMGKSFIDETSLFEQAKPQQDIVNKRGRQVMENADYVNGRWVARKDAFNEEDAQKLINKGPKTVAMVSGETAVGALVNVASQEMSQYAVNTIYDARNEIDAIMGTPSQFKGADPTSKQTATRDLMVKQSAGALQDDIVSSVTDAMETYYKIKLQLMLVNYDEDHWFTCKGADGKYIFILLNSDAIDANVKIGVQAESNLPLDKAQIRNTSMDLWKAGNAIDYRTLMEDLGLPDPEQRAERYLKEKTDPINFLRSLEVSQINSDAEADIQLLLAKKKPEEKDDYDAEYLNYYNKVVASNRFQKMKPDAQQRVMAYLMIVQHVAQQSANLQALSLDAADLLSPLPQPMAQPGAPSPAPNEAPTQPMTGQQATGNLPTPPVQAQTPSPVL